MSYIEYYEHCPFCMQMVQFLSDSKEPIKYKWDRIKAFTHHFELTDDCPGSIIMGAISLAEDYHNNTGHY